jgi:hypothetical protein
VLLKLVMPTIHSKMDSARIDVINVSVGDALERGARLLEFTMGLDAASAHDCPPLTSYRMTLSEAAWLRQLNVKQGADLVSGDVLALLTTEPEESFCGEHDRLARVAIAAIVKPMAW